MECRLTPTEHSRPGPVRRAGKTGDSIIGYAAVFYRAGDASTEYQLWAGAVERIMPSAFDEAIRRDDVRALFNHDMNHVLGRTKSGTLRLRVDSVGLRYEIEPADTTLHRDLVVLLRRGDVDGSSFSFAIDGQDHWRRENGREVREIRSVRLFDVGPVTTPAYSGTTSGAGDAVEAEQAARQQWLRDADLRIRDADLRWMDSLLLAADRRRLGQ